MFCPGCSLHVNDDLKFCRQCGANLHSVREAMTSQSTGEKFDWSKTWWAEMIYSPGELERRRGITPEEKRLNEEKKRLNEVKGGVITSLVGVSVMISFYFFFAAVAKQAGDGAEIVRNLWLLGIIPTLIGAGLLINGFFISRRLVNLNEQLARTARAAAPAPPTAQAGALVAKTTDQLIVDATPAAGHSVTEDSTAHLLEPVHAPLRRETD
ncbi:MAG TPA: hypothetical protein VFV58_02740 [Blastocatellia bacterium]|jgi:hypothetical protein|nr:hypothetical protein [Blastocatellia bacterium]